MVVSDNANGAHRLIEHLISVGHREIAHITDAEDTSTGQDRLRGFREALGAGGVSYHPELVFRTTVDRIGGYRATQEILTNRSSPADAKAAID
ncbi:MAG TPA: substrate-binding domain-containing protein [Beijerinckiaceae bacterium]|nr:substrate-binding domain-containing protein [Beijerinckiaceae bacterium]